MLPCKNIYMDFCPRMYVNYFEMQVFKIPIVFIRYE